MNCLIIHGCPSNAEKSMDPATRTYDKHWLPWLKQELDRRNIPTQIPLLPEPWNPNYEAFKKEFEKYPVNENTVLVGHSCGGTFLARWLGESRQKVAKLIIVAPWKSPKYNKEDDRAEEEFYSYPLDERVKDLAGEIIFFSSDNEKEAGKEGLKLFHQALGGKIITLPNHGHYTEKDMGTEKFPELLAEILK